MLNGLALFAGIGGIEMGISDSVRTVCYVEKEPYSVAVLRSRIKEGKLHNAPIWDDVSTFYGVPYRGIIDIITGGFPCQDISVAGKGKGIKEGTRSGLWYEMLRIINEVRPTFVFVENVSAITKRGLDIVLGQLSEAGYDAGWTYILASDVGAPHKRERIFILAYPRDSSDRTNGGTLREEDSIQKDGRKEVCARMPCGTGEVGNTKGTGQQMCNLGQGKMQSWGTGSWDVDPADLNPSSESYVGRVADGVPKRVDRIKCLGNAVVPEQAKKAWEILTGES